MSRKKNVYGRNIKQVSQNFDCHESNNIHYPSSLVLHQILYVMSSTDSYLTEGKRASSRRGDMLKIQNTIVIHLIEMEVRLSMSTTQCYLQSLLIPT